MTLRESGLGTPRVGAVGQPPLRRYLPSLGWLLHYRREDLLGDLMAGLIVAIMLVPQSMAYALLAGLPPQAGLYASIVPTLIYGLFGTSRYLAVGPVAIVSLLVATGLGDLAPQGTADYVVLALGLALLAGVFQLAMGFARIGFLVNVLSHPVLSGFTSAAAIVIAMSQVHHLLGITVPRGHSLHEVLFYVGQRAPESNLVTAGIGVGSIAILGYFAYVLRDQLEHWRIPTPLIEPIARGAPLVVVLGGTLLVWALALHETMGVRIVGTIPAGLPGLTMPPVDPAILAALLPSTLTIVFVGYLESISVAKSLASKRRQKVDANQELVALGMANIGAAFTGGYPVTGSFSRSVVNYAAGANTGLASLITVMLMALALVALMPLLYFLPQTVLAAIIIIACVNLLDVATLRLLWCYNKADAAALLITFGSVLVIGVESGIVVGIISALVLYLWRTSRPRVTVVGRVGNSEHFRSVLRHDVRTCPHALAVRVDASLYFANGNAIADVLRAHVADSPDVKHVVLICSGINFIDASALETLESLVHELREAGVTFHLAEVKAPVLDRLERVEFDKRLGEGRVFLSTHQAMRALGCE
jgi:SulP family sulfate permease